MIRAIVMKQIPGERIQSQKNAGWTSWQENGVAWAVREAE
jgi:hypothetical protein